MRIWEIFTPSLCFSLSSIISLTASLIVNLSLEFHTFPKCVSPFCLISSKPSVTQQICNELALCQSKKKKKKVTSFSKRGDQHFNLSERERRTKGKSGRANEEKGWDGAHAFFSSPCFVHYALEIWNPFVFHSGCILLAVQSLVWT